MEPWRTIVTAGLPLDPGDLGIATEVIDGRRNQVRDGLGIGAVEVRIGHEPSAASKPHQAQRSETRYGGGARRLRFGAQLSVVGGEELVSVRHQNVALTPDNAERTYRHPWSPAVADLISQAAAATSGAKIESFRPLLVERRAGDQLIGLRQGP